MRILSDFDGVLTDQTEEAQRVLDLFMQRFCEATGLNQSDAKTLIENIENEMKQNPTENGWRMSGRITAFANEDLFIHNNGIAALLDDKAKSNDQTATKLLSQLHKNDIRSFSDLMQWAYEQMVKETHVGKLKPMDPATKTVINHLLGKGHTITIVSNSGTDRILNLLKNEGLEAYSHDENPNARLKVRGDARKFELEDPKKGFNVPENNNSYWVDVARPRYETIVKEELPHVVIGDVFTLDLAVPLSLTRIAPENFGGMQLFLRKRNYTPQWSEKFIRNNHEKSAKLNVLNDLKELLEL